MNSEWLLSEPVRLTVLPSGPIWRDGAVNVTGSVYLAERVSGPGAFVITWDRRGMLLNGQFVELDERAWSLADEISEIATGLPVGTTVTLEAPDGFHERERG